MEVILNSQFLCTITRSMTTYFSRFRGVVSFNDSHNQLICPLGGFFIIHPPEQKCKPSRFSIAVFKIISSTVHVHTPEIMNVPILHCRVLVLLIGHFYCDDSRSISGSDFPSTKSTQASLWPSMYFAQFGGHMLSEP